MRVTSGATSEQRANLEAYEVLLKD